MLGNVVGDGFEAAAQLRAMLPHAQIMVSEVRAPAEPPSDAQISRNTALQAGVQWLNDAPADLGPQDLCVDALLGIGLSPRTSEKTSTADQRLLQLLAQVQPMLEVIAHVVAGKCDHRKWVATDNADLTGNSSGGF
mgnify:CR=1 FL=1